MKISVAGELGIALVPASLRNLRLPAMTYRPIKDDRKQLAWQWYGRETAGLNTTGLPSRLDELIENDTYLGW